MKSSAQRTMPRECRYSQWFGPQYIVRDQYVDKWEYPEYCAYLRKVYGSSCESWAPKTKEETTQLMKDFLVWQYGNDISAWAKSCGLGNKWKFVFEFEWEGDWLRGLIGGEPSTGKGRYGGRTQRRKLAGKTRRSTRTK